MTAEPGYLLRLIDRGSIRGVPVVDMQLLRVDGPAHACVLHSVGLGLSPPTAAHLAESFAVLGVAVERETRVLEAIE